MVSSTALARAILNTSSFQFFYSKLYLSVNTVVGNINSAGCSVECVTSKKKGKHTGEHAKWGAVVVGLGVTREIQEIDSFDLKYHVKLTRKKA